MGVFTFMKYKNINVPFTQIPNELINDVELSWSAKGVYCYLASKPDDWQFYETEIAKNSNMGLTATKTALKQLIENGWLKRTLQRNEKGQNNGYLYELINKAETSKPNIRKSNIGFPHTNNTNNTNTDISNTLSKDNDKPTVYGKPEINELLEYWKQTTQLKVTKVKDQRNALNTLLKHYSVDEIKLLINVVTSSYTDKFAPQKVKCTTLRDLCYNHNQVNVYARTKLNKRKEIVYVAGSN
jgi:hypothetical protein